MFTPIETPNQLPETGRVNEKAYLDFKSQPTNNGFEIAKDIAAMANGEGGTLLLGAHGDGEILGKYVPLSRADASQTQKTYEQAVRDRCSPPPLFTVEPIERDDGFIVAVNVWPFPGQLVGVRLLKGEAKCGPKDREVTGVFYFPVRVGSHTKAVTPEMIPMFMDARARRIASCLADAVGAEMVIISSDRSDGSHHLTSARLLALDALGNTVTFSVLMSVDPDVREEVSVPIEALEAVWRVGKNWHVILGGRLRPLKWLPGGEPELAKLGMFFAPKAWEPARVLPSRDIRQVEDREQAQTVLAALSSAYRVLRQRFGVLRQRTH